MERLLLAVVAEMLADDESFSMPGFRQFRTAEAPGVEHAWGWWRTEDYAEIHGLAGYFQGGSS